MDHTSNKQEMLVIIYNEEKDKSIQFRRSTEEVRKMFEYFSFSSISFDEAMAAIGMRKAIQND